MLTLGQDIFLNITIMASNNHGLACFWLVAFLFGKTLAATFQSICLRPFPASGKGSFLKTLELNVG